jgi:hypothetical protein
MIGGIMDKDQRKFDRIEIPDASVNIYIGQKKFKLFPGYSKSLPLKDLTKCGLCFKCERQLNIGQIVELRVNTGKTRPFRLKVKILWCVQDEVDRRYTTGARIMPFGSMNNLNSMRSLHRLKELELTFSEASVIQ